MTELSASNNFNESKEFKLSIQDQKVIKIVKSSKKEDKIYCLLDKLGQGAHGAVFGYQSNDLKMKALKITCNEDLSPEYGLMKEIYKNNDGKIEGVILPPKALFKLGEIDFLIMPKYETRLDDWIKTNRSIKNLVDGLKQIAKGLNYLHSLNIAHGDITELNILLRFDKNNNKYRFDISDFGEAVYDATGEKKKDDIVLFNMLKFFFKTCLDKIEPNLKEREVYDKFKEILEKEDEEYVLKNIIEDLEKLLEMLDISREK